MGVVLTLVLPLAFLLGSAIFIWRYLYHPRAPQRRAAFILMQDPDEPMVGPSAPIQSLNPKLQINPKS